MPHAHPHCSKRPVVPAVPNDTCHDAGCNQSVDNINTARLWFRSDRTVALRTVRGWSTANGDLVWVLHTPVRFWLRRGQRRTFWNAQRQMTNLRCVTTHRKRRQATVMRLTLAGNVLQNGRDQLCFALKNKVKVLPPRVLIRCFEKIEGEKELKFELEPDYDSYS